MQCAVYTGAHTHRHRHSAAPALSACLPVLDQWTAAWTTGWTGLYRLQAGPLAGLCGLEAGPGGLQAYSGSMDYWLDRSAACVDPD